MSATSAPLGHSVTCLKKEPASHLTTPSSSHPSIYPLIRDASRPSRQFFVPSHKKRWNKSSTEQRAAAAAVGVGAVTINTRASEAVDEVGVPPIGRRCERVWARCLAIHHRTCKYQQHIRQMSTEIDNANPKDEFGKSPTRPTNLLATKPPGRHTISVEDPEGPD